MKSVDIIGVIDLQGVSLVYFYFVIRPGILSNMVEHIISLLIHIVIGTWYHASVGIILIGCKLKNMIELISLIWCQL